MTTAIQVNDLHYTYEGQDGGETHIVFDGLSLSIEQGSFVAVLGHNGCGKSTLAKHFNAILLPAGGSVTVYGMDTKDEEMLLAIRQHVGMVFQNPDNQIVSNVVEEDVAFAPENLGVASQEIRQPVGTFASTSRKYAAHGTPLARAKARPTGRASLTTATA